MDKIRAAVRAGDASKEAVGLRLALVREALGFTQAQMASLMGTTTSNYQHAEKGGTFPRPHFVQRLMDAERIDHNFVYAGDPSRLPGMILDWIEANRTAGATG